MFMLRRFVRNPARGDSRRSCFASCRHKVSNKLANVRSERQTLNEDMETHILALPGDHSAAVGLVLWNRGLNIRISSAPHSCPPTLCSRLYPGIQLLVQLCGKEMDLLLRMCPGGGHVPHLQMTSKPASEFHTLSYTSNYFLSSPGQRPDNNI